MATSAQHITASKDADLRERLIAIAEMEGIDAPSFWVESNIGKLLSTTVSGEQVLADVHAYAVASYVPAPRPGEDPTKVMDDHLRTAVQAHKPTP
jgi:hypothetical protein